MYQKNTNKILAPELKFIRQNLTKYNVLLLFKVMEMILALLYESDLILSDDLVKAIIDKVRTDRFGVT